MDNVSMFNNGFGLELGGGAAYGRNVLYDNVYGATTGFGFQVDTNLCDSLTACP